MNPSDTISLDELQIERLFEEAGLQELPVLNDRRVEMVMERAMHEKLMGELSSFMFQGFPAVVDGLLSAAGGRINHPDDDYKV